jgi:hypothetical protein
MEKDEETEICAECSILNVCFSFDVGRWTFDVGCSSLKAILYGINVTRQCLKNNLALMGPTPVPALFLIASHEIVNILT